MSFLDKPFSMISESRAHLFARYALGLILVWFGVMNFSAVGAGIVGNWLGGHLFLSGMADSAGTMAMIIGAIQVLLGVGLVLPMANLQQKAALGAAVFSFLALTLMVFGNVWLPGEGGGFPLLGSGQGVIKYVSILGVALFLGGGAIVSKRAALSITAFGIFLVMAWIGYLKFYEFEALGIQPLLETSFLFSWLYSFFDVQGASNFIGTVEIIAALALLIGWFKHKMLFQIGAAVCIITFLGTLSFMLTLPGWDGGLGFPAIGGTGIFLMKDLVMLGGTFLLIANYED